jgi:hypothetical protein
MPLTVIGRPPRIRGRESGQILILALGVFVLLLGFAAIVVDGGFYLQRRERIQHITDAAALAGAQELPDDPALAEAAAREWADRNGLDGDTLTITFECRSDSPCPPPHFVNTIIVDGEMKAPLALMPILRLVGASGGSCWLNGGCTVDGSASAEAVTGTGETDIVVILDRTASMSGSDLNNAEDGTRTMLEVLNPDLQDVGLAVLPPSRSQDFNQVCQPWDASGDDQWGVWPDNWLVSELANDYQLSDGSLNDGSRLLRIIACLQSNPRGATNIGYPIRAARQHLANDGRPGASKAIVLLTDGAANRPEGANPCTLADNEATIAKRDYGIEMYVIGYGVNDPGTGQTCQNDDPGTYWRGRTSEELVYSMATDDDHAFIEPKSEDLIDVFEEIGQRLAAGYRLVD